MHLRRTGLGLASLSFLAAVACGGGVRPTPNAPTPPPSTPSSVDGVETTTTSVPSGPPTVAEAQAFMDQVEKDLHKLWVARDRAAWVSLTYITDDTEALAAAGEQRTAEYVTRKIAEAQRFKGLALPEPLARQFSRLSLAQVVPAPKDPAKASELASIEAAMTGAYGKGQYCPADGSKLAAWWKAKQAKEQKPGAAKAASKCMHLDDLDAALGDSRDPAVLAEAWTGWHGTAKEQRDRYTKYVALGNEGAREIGFADLGALWRSNFDMKPEEFEADVERLWNDVKPLYDELHCYARAKLRARYGKDKVPEHAPIPAQLLGNMWAQQWTDLFDDVFVPYKGQPSLNVSKTLAAKKTDAKGMVKMGESFFTSLGFDPLPATFWERSMFTRPTDRDVVCHASAWDVLWNDDLRIKMCIQPTEENLVTIHHELGHDFYFSQYYKLPVLFQQGANDGFHEAIGDTIALSVTPQYLKDRGLLEAVPKDDKAHVNAQMKAALQKVAFLPFGLLIDKWRWDVFSGKTTPDHYNQAWWALKAKYQGVAPPSERGETEFDPAAKFHIASSTPYIRYFLAFIYEFQFHRALCKAAGFNGPLDQCSIYGNAEAGKKLRAMLQLGQSKPWQDAMEAMTGERKADASALLEYFAPLRTWMKDQIKDEKCGW